MISTWTRRAITWPLLLATFSVVLGLLPAWMLLAFAIDIVSGRIARLPVTRTLLLVSTYLACEVAGVIAAGAVWMATFAANSATRVAANAALQRAWTGALFWAVRTFFGMSLVVEGADLVTPAPFLLFVRHSSTADTLLGAAVIANPHHIVLRYVLKEELRWDPCLDLVGGRLPNAFVDRSGDARAEQLAAIAALADDLDRRSAVLIYPEGTRFSARKRDRAVARLEAEGKSELAALARTFSHVLPPRLGGPLTLLEKLRGHDVVFLEHYGFEGAESFATLARGVLVGGRIDVRLRRVRAEDIPREDLDVWLFTEWRRTDEWVATRAAAHTV